jgi:lysyl endopeptidase
MDKKISTFIAVVLMVFSGYNLAFSQLSSGGTPPSFRYAPSISVPIVTMPSVNVDSMLAEDAIDAQSGTKPFRFGYNHLVYYNTQNSGIWTTLGNGDRIWQLDIQTPGSYTINMAFAGFHLTEGAKLFVYSKDHRQILGAFTSANNTPDKFFGTELIYGDEAIVEYYEPAAARGQNNFTLFRITHGYKDLSYNSLLKVGFGTAGSCIHNINCPQYAAYWTQKRAVVMVIIEGNTFCSGSLINDCLSDGAPYILTANHCSVNNADGAWIFRFNYEAPGCTDPADEPSTAQSISGATTFARDTFSDFHLVKIGTTPPCSFHPFYAGWSRSSIPATSVTCIHHPEGDIKKCSQANNPVTDTIYEAGTYWSKVWQIGQWTDGATEPGSSGSPLFDQNKRIIGQLYGGPSDCNESPDQLRDYYGRFNVSWDSVPSPQSRLKDWLDPGNTNAMTNDGYDPCPVNYSLNMALLQIITPISCSSSMVPAIYVENTGATTLTSFTITYKVNNNPDTSFVWTGTLQYLDSTLINLPAITGNNGQNTLFVAINAPNNGIDTDLYNDSAVSTFLLLSSSAQAPLTQGFESGTFPPAGWNITTPQSGTTWELSSYGGYGQSTGSASVNEYSPTSSTQGETPGLISPLISMANLPNHAYLTFDRAYQLNLGYSDTLAVLVSTDCGTTWTTIYKKGGNSLATKPSAVDTLVFTPTSGQWATDTVDISNLAGNASLLFNFEVISGWGNAFYLDNINIGDTSFTLGINPVTNDINVKVYPNPFTDNFSLQFTLNEAQNIDAVLYSIDGKKLVTVMNNVLKGPGMHQVEINTQQLSNGIYFLKVNDRFFKIEKLK